MSFPGHPQLVRGGIALVDIDTSSVLRVAGLQYNPDTLTRTLQVQGAGGESPDHLEALRLKAPPIETIKLEAEFDATDDTNPNKDVYAQLAALESIVYPSTADVLLNLAYANAGQLEILPVTAPLQVFVWSKQRVVPVRITDFSITEDAFAPDLTPLRAKVSLTMRVLTVYDLGFDNKGGSLFLGYQLQKELAGIIGSTNLQTIGQTLP
jgi:Contractile injection system tube protein